MSAKISILLDSTNVSVIFHAFLGQIGVKVMDGKDFYGTFGLWC